MTQLRYLLALALSFLVVASHAQAAFFGRLPTTPGGTDYQAYYDDELNITWLADANFAMTSGFDDTGRLTWDMASAWVASLTIEGVGGWLLPSMDINGDGNIVFCEFASAEECLDNQHGYRFYQNGVTPSIPGPFSNLLSGEQWWSETEADPDGAWVFGGGFRRYGTGDGLQGVFNKTSTAMAWPVRTGDVGVIPLPAGFWLLGSAMLVLGRFNRKTS